MRFAPITFALSAVLAMTSSVSHSREEALPERAAVLLAQGRAAIQAGDSQKARDALEAALVFAPGSAQIWLALAEAARLDGLPGKALAYYRKVLQADPTNLAALEGEGEAYIERGALEKARRNLARLEALCGESCPQTRKLAQRLDQAQRERMAARGGEKRAN